jgi:hypothetical protein
MTHEDIRRLVDAGLLEGKLEYLDGELRIGNYPFVFSPEHARDAAAVGVHAPTPEDAVAPPGVPTTVTVSVHPACRTVLGSDGWCHRCETTPEHSLQVEYRAPRVVGELLPSRPRQRSPRRRY